MRLLESRKPRQESSLMSLEILKGNKTRVIKRRLACVKETRVPPRKSAVYIITGKNIASHRQFPGRSALEHTNRMYVIWPNKASFFY